MHLKIGVINIKIKEYLKERYKVIIVIVVLLTTTVIAAAYDEKMLITGIGAIRVDQEIRISNLKQLSSENGGFETYQSRYGKDSIRLMNSLPEKDSAVTYQVTIKNKSEHVYVISEITEENDNSEIECKIDNDEYKIGQGIRSRDDLTFNITCRYKGELPENRKQVINLKFKFERPYAAILRYDNSTSKSKCDNVQCALDDLYDLLGG